MRHLGRHVAAVWIYRPSRCGRIGRGHDVFGKQIDKISRRNVVADHPVALGHHERRIGGHKARAKDPRRNNRVKAAVGLAPKKRCADWTLIIAASGWLLALNHTNVAIATWCPYLTLSVLIRILRCHSSN